MGTRAIHVSGFGRHEHDYYQTPPWVTAALLRRVSLRSSVWEPCCGDGSIARVLSDAGHAVVATDLVERGYGRGGVDVFACRNLPTGCVSVVTNPPYGDGGPRSDNGVRKSPRELLRFTRHLLELAADVQGQVALLVRLQWIAGKRAAALLQSAPLHSVIVLTHRIQWFNDPVTGKPAQHHHVWLVFDFQRPSDQPPVLWFEEAHGDDAVRRCVVCGTALAVTAAPRTVVCSAGCRKALAVRQPLVMVPWEGEVGDSPGVEATEFLATASLLDS